MIKLIGYVVKIYPTNHQIEQINRDMGCARYVYNKALELKKRAFELDWVNYSAYDLIKLLPYWKEADPWLKLSSDMSLQQAVRDLGKAFNNLIKYGYGYPEFKKKGDKDSCRYCGATSIVLNAKDKKIRMPKMGWVKYRDKANIFGKLKSITISKQAGEYYASILMEQEVKIPLPKGGEIAIDVGVKRLAAFSDGTYADGFNFNDEQVEIKKLQKKLQRQTKGGRNYEKTKLKISKLYKNISNKSKDRLHKITTDICENQAIIYAEDILVKNLSKSAKGTIDNPGTNVRQKAGLNRSILSQGWGEFFRQLEYKSAWRGGQLVRVNPKNTSRTCPECGCVSKENRKTQANFTCIDCGYSNNADFVGALNILRAGHAQLACKVNGAVMPSAARTC